MNWYKIFYALTVSDGVKTFFDVASNIFTWLAVISFIALFIITLFKIGLLSDNKIKTDEQEKVDPDSRALNKGRVYVRNFFYTMLALSIFTWGGWVFTPTKKDCVMIIAGGGVATFLTSDTSARKIPTELMELGVVAIQSWKDQIKNFSTEEKKSLGLLTEEEKKKDDLLTKVGAMTKDEIVNWIQNDTTIKFK